MTDKSKQGANAMKRKNDKVTAVIEMKITPARGTGC